MKHFHSDKEKEIRMRREELLGEKDLVIEKLRSEAKEAEAKWSLTGKRMTGQNDSLKARRAEVKELRSLLRDSQKLDEQLTSDFQKVTRPSEAL